MVGWSVILQSLLLLFHQLRETESVIQVLNLFKVFKTLKHWKFIEALAVSLDAVPVAVLKVLAATAEEIATLPILGEDIVFRVGFDLVMDVELALHPFSFLHCVLGEL